MDSTCVSLGHVQLSINKVMYVFNHFFSMVRINVAQKFNFHVTNGVGEFIFVNHTIRRCLFSPEQTCSYGSVLRRATPKVGRKVLSHWP